MKQDHVGAVIIRIGLGGMLYYIMIRNPELVLGII